MYVGGCLTFIPAYDGVEMVDCAVSVLPTDRPTNTTITTIATSIQLFNCLAKHVHVKFVAAVWNPALIVLAYSFFFLAKADLPVAVGCRCRHPRRRDCRRRCFSQQQRCFALPPFSKVDGEHRAATLIVK